MVRVHGWELSFHVFPCYENSALEGGTVAPVSLVDTASLLLGLVSLLGN